jgi:hypothetical protein
MASTTCPACQGLKDRGALFCATDTSALTWQLRRRENFDAALRHLQLHLERRRVYSRGRSFAWPFTSVRELAEANYELLADRPERCRVPRCGQQILFVKTPLTGDVVVINRADVKPHFTTCADPDWFARQRRLQASAGSAKGQGRRAKKRRRA